MNSKITEISSPTHTLEVNMNDKTASVKLKYGENVNNHNETLAIFIAQTDPFFPRCWVEPIIIGETIEGYNSMAILQPQAAPYPQAEFIFVVDRSGSMEGTQIRDAKNALHILLRSIPKGSKFNIIGFGTDFQFMALQSVLYNEASFTLANNVVNSTEADMGGTNLLKPLDWISKQQVDPEFPRQVFVITDGQIENENTVFTLVKNLAQSTPTRVFSLGIGYDVSRKLISGLAEVGDGTSVFVRTGEKMEKKVVGQLKMSLQSSFTNGVVNWSVNGEQIPPTLPPIFSCSRLIVYFISKEEPKGVTLEATADKSSRVTVGLTLQKSPEIGMVQKLTAKAMIRYWEDYCPQKMNEIIDLSVKNQVLSSLTAYVVVEQRTDSVQGTMLPITYTPLELALCPPEVTIDADLMAQYEKELQEASCMGLPDEDDEDFLGSPGPSFPSVSIASTAVNYQTITAEEVPKGPRNETYEKMSGIIRLQAFDGSWNLDENLALAINITLSVLIANQPAGTSEKLWATALVVAFLGIKLLSLRDAWEMSAQKSLDLLVKNNSVSVLEKARELIARGM